MYAVVIFMTLFCQTAMGGKFNSHKITYIAPASLMTKEVAQKKEVSFLGINNKSTVSDDSFPFCIQNDQKKVEHIDKALHDKKSYLWCVKGGYGSARLFDGLNKLPPPHQAKVVIGFSDITFLHLFLNQKWGWKTIHGAMPGMLIKQDPYNFYQIQNIMDKEKGTLKYDGLVPMNAQASSQKELCGPVTGGCLTLLVNSLGTAWQLDAKGKILMIEDVGVKGYEVDRYLTQIKQSGALHGVRAIIFGSFIPKEGDIFCDKALTTFAQESTIPVFSCDWFGHGFKNYPVPFGCPATIKKGDSNLWSLEIGYDFSSAQSCPA